MLVLVGKEWEWERERKCMCWRFSSFPVKLSPLCSLLWKQDSATFMELGKYQHATSDFVLFFNMINFIHHRAGQNYAKDHDISLLW